MPTFLADLRQKIGHDLVLLPAVVGVVLNDAGEVLCLRRSDTGAWSLPSGIAEPGEQPAQTLTREIYEETNLIARPTRLLGTFASTVKHYPNGDRAQYVATVFLCDVVSGTLHPNDGEALELAFFAAGDMPQVSTLEHHFSLSSLLADTPAFVWDDIWLTPTDPKTSPTGS
jgi:8-oxo-dGTP pyrophosphatase MutT (NUDIX family)